MPVCSRPLGEINSARHERVVLFVGCLGLTPGRGMLTLGHGARLNSVKHTAKGPKNLSLREMRVNGVVASTGGHFPLPLSGGLGARLSERAGLVDDEAARGLLEHAVIDPIVDHRRYRRAVSAGKVRELPDV